MAGLAKVLTLLLLVLAFPAGAQTVVVLNSGEGTMSLLDAGSYKETARVAVGREPHHLMLTPDRRELIIANAVSHDLVFLDPATGAVKRRLPKVPDPYQIGFSPDRRWFAVASLALDRVDLYAHDQGNLTLAHRIPLKTMPSHLAFSKDSRFVFVTMQGSGKVAALELDGGKVAWSKPVGSEPAGIWMTPNGVLLVGIMGSDHVAVVDAADGRVIRRIITGKGAHNFFPARDGKVVYLTNRVAGTVSALNPNTLDIVATYKVPGGPDCVDISADGSELWVGARWAKQVHVVDAASGTIKTSIPVGRSPHGIYLHAGG